MLRRERSEDSELAEPPFMLVPAVRVDSHMLKQEFESLDICPSATVDIGVALKQLTGQPTGPDPGSVLPKDISMMQLRRSNWISNRSMEPPRELSDSFCSARPT
jgi:hypothetical protein